MGNYPFITGGISEEHSDVKNLHYATEGVYGNKEKSVLFN